MGGGGGGGAHVIARGGGEGGHMSLLVGGGGGGGHMSLLKQTENDKPTGPVFSSGLLKCCFTSAETVGLLGTGAQDGHLDFHTAPERCLVDWIPRAG